MTASFGNLKLTTPFRNTEYLDIMDGWVCVRLLYTLFCAPSIKCVAPCFAVDVGLYPGLLMGGSCVQPLTLEDMRLSEGGKGGSLSLASFEPEFMRPVPPLLPIADSEVRRPAYCIHSPFLFEIYIT